MNNKKLNTLRGKIDKLDFKLLDLIKKRSKFVDEVIKNKKHKKQIIDKSRINKVLKSIKKNSIKKKIDTNITRKIWTSMIRAFIDYEKKNFNKR